MVSPEVIRLKNEPTDKDHSIGPATAPVTLVEYGNFECIDCGRAFRPLKEARHTLGDNLRFVFRHFPSVRSHPHAMRAAEASESAAAQGHFWEMHDELFTHQDQLDDQHLARYARSIHLDVENFERDMAEHSFLKQIEADYETSLFDEHITGTPTIYLNNRRYNGPTDLDSLIVAIKQADTENVIVLPESLGRIRHLLERLHHRKA